MTNTQLKVFEQLVRHVVWHSPEFLCNIWGNIEEAREVAFYLVSIPIRASVLVFGSGYQGLVWANSAHKPMPPLDYGNALYAFFSAVSRRFFAHLRHASRRDLAPTSPSFLLCILVTVVRTTGQPLLSKLVFKLELDTSYTKRGYMKKKVIRARHKSKPKDNLRKSVKSSQPDKGVKAIGKKRKRPGSRSREKSLKSDQAIAAIRKLILLGELRAGVRTSADELRGQLAKDKLSVARVTVRQAIEHYTSWGIFKVEPKKSTTIPPISSIELKTIWSSRLSIELAVLRELASNSARDLSAVVAQHNKMLEILGPDDNLDGIPTDEQRYDFIEADERLHEAFCDSAGVEPLKPYLQCLRLKLRIASPANQLLETRRRMSSIVHEHGAILQALQPGGIRPAYNQVQHAFLTHMRYAARDSWKIPGENSSLLRYATDVPENQVTGISAELPLSYPFLLRYCTEITAVWNLASCREPELDQLRSIQHKMRDILHCVQNSGKVSPEDENAFINYDIDLHSGICFLGGLYFGEDIVTSVWRKLHAIHNHPVDLGHMKVVVEQHDAILLAIENSRGTVEGAKAACEKLTRHLCSAFIVHNMEPSERTAISEVLRNLASQLDAIWR
jgi:DNA-binding GntR family transcriptional regulator